MFWSYILGMLTNLERIYQLLKIFAIKGPSPVGCDMQELSAL